MRRLSVFLLAFLAVATPAQAHRLKLFATVEAGSATGYAFFVGGGRAAGATLVVRDAAEHELARLLTDAEGGFSYRPTAPGELRLSVDAGDGHAALAILTAERFGPSETGAALAATPVDPAPEPPSSSDLQTMIDRSVDAAVARQIRPLLEAYAAADGRIRFNDVMGGVGMIVGLAGLALWATARRRRPDRPDV